MGKLVLLGGGYVIIEMNKRKRDINRKSIWKMSN